jgi:hypothetical protein
MAKQAITIGGAAVNWCRNVGVAEDDLRTARAGEVTVQTGEYLIVYGVLLDGRRVRMLCPPARPNHITSFRVVR